jgi:eukaryotic-like serine/threonine-protein kinase
MTTNIPDSREHHDTVPVRRKARTPPPEIRQTDARVDTRFADDIERTLLLLPGQPNILAVNGTPYRVLQKLGKGGIGRTFLAERAEGGAPAVLKVITAEGGIAHKPVENMLDSADQESAALGRIGERIADETVVRDKKKHRLLVMTYHEGKTLTEHMQNGRTGMPTLRALEIVHVLAQQLLHYADDHLLLHHDLKPDNVIIKKDSGEPKLIDWGASTFIDRHQDNPHPLGMVTAQWGPPEHGEKFIGSMRGQVHSLATVVLELTKKKPADFDSPLKDTLENALNKNPTKRPEIGKFIAVLHGTIHGLRRG